MVLTLTVDPIETDEEYGKKYQGTWINDTTGFKIIKDDTDVYGIDDNGEKRLLAKFRKQVLPKDVVQKGWDAFRNAGVPSRNSGAAAGPIDQKGKYWSRRKPTHIDKWSTRYIQNGKVSKMRVNNNVSSGIVGFYESTPFLGIPCRMTSYTRNNLKNYLLGIPFLQAIDDQFQKLAPESHAKQLALARKHKDYQIEDTAFSTVTINVNFRTAVHKDAGDYAGGFGNLSVIEWGKYSGAYTVMPRYKIGFDVRTGDFLAMDVHEWHANTAFEETEEDKKYNQSLPDIRTRDPEVGVAGSDRKFTRLTFVCYFREKIVDCEDEKTKAYYKREGFDVKEEYGLARRASVATLPLPGFTGTIEDAHYSMEHTDAGRAAKSAQTKIKTRKAKDRKRAKTEKQKKPKGQRRSKR